MEKKCPLSQRASINSDIKRVFIKFLRVNTCSTDSHDPFLLQHLKIDIRLILNTSFNFVSCCSLGCISWQCNRKENFVNGDQMSKWRLFMDWWAQKQGGKKPRASIISQAPGWFSSCQTWSFPNWVEPSLFHQLLKLTKSSILLFNTALRLYVLRVHYETCGGVKGNVERSNVRFLQPVCYWNACASQLFCAWIVLISGQMHTTT